MKELEGSKTLANLLAAFAGESQAAMKYGIYAAKAKADGYEQIAEIFTKTAENEQQHAKIWYKLINNGVGDTKVNLEKRRMGNSLSGPRCIRNLLRLPVKKALSGSLFSLTA